VVDQVLDGALAGGGILREEAQSGDHGQAAVLLGVQVGGVGSGWCRGGGRWR